MDHKCFVAFIREEGKEAVYKGEDVEKKMKRTQVILYLISQG
jgi:hypothetical protein